jgi:hypothetical protein
VIRAARSFNQLPDLLQKKVNLTPTGCTVSAFPC